MDAQSGSLHFETGINKNPYIQGLIDMENRTLLFGQNVTNGNAAIQKSFDRLAGSIGNGRLNKAIDGADQRIEQFVNSVVSNTNRGGIGFTQFSATASNSLVAIQTQFQRLGTAAQANMTKASAAVSGFANNANTNGQQLSATFGNLGTAIAGYFTLQTLRNFGNEVLTVTGQIQQLQVAYTTILASKRQADALFAETVALAKTTPFSLLDVATGTKQLLAYGFSAQEVTGTLSKLGDIAAGVGAPLGDVAYLYGTLKTQGRAYAQDIRQFTGRGIPIIAELAKQFGTTESNVNKLVEAGKVGFPEVERAFNTLTGSGGQFFNMMQEQSKTVTGQISNLKDNFDQLLAKIGKGNQGFINDGISGLNSLIDNYQKILDIIKVLIVTYGAYEAVQLVQLALANRQTIAIALETAAYALLRDGIGLLNKELVVASLQTAALTGVFAALAGIVYALTATTNAYTISKRNLEEINKEGVKNTIGQIDKIRSLEKSIGSLKNTEDQRLQAVTKLRDVMGERLKQYSNEEILAGKAKNAINDYTEAILRNAKAGAAQSKLQEIEEQLLATDAKSKTGNQTDRVNQSFDNIPLRERLKYSVTNMFSKNGALSNLAPLNDYRQGLKQQRAAILNAYGEAIDDINAGIDRTNNDPKVKQALAFQKLLENVTKNFDQLIKTSSGLADFRAIGKALGDALELPNISDKQIEQIKRDQEKLQPYLDKYSLKYDKKQQGAEEDYLQKRSAIFDKLAKLEYTRTADAKTQDEKELDQVRAKYKALLDEATAYNEKAKKNGKPLIGKAFFTRLGGDQQKELDDTKARQQLVPYKNTLEGQKILFDDFEKYKSEVGTTEANKRYADDLKGFKSYVDFLQNEIDKLDGLNDPLSNAEKDFLGKEKAKADNEQIKRQAALYSKLLIDTQTYEDKRTILKEVAEQSIATLTSKGRLKEAEVRRQQYQDEVTELDLANVKKLASYRELFDNVNVISEASARKDLDNLQTFIDNAKAAGTITQRAYDEINKLIINTRKNLDNKVYNNLLLIADAFSQISGAMSGVSSELSGLISGIGGAISSFAQVGKLANDLKEAKALGDKDAQGQATAGLIVAGISGAAKIISTIAGAAADRKKSEEAYYNSVLKQQNDYNLALNEEIRLRTELNENVFTKDYRGRIVDGTKALADANAKYMESLEKLNSGKVKTGQRNAVNPTAIGSTVAGGVALGAAIGSVVPVIGTAVGAVVGGIVGAISGLFGGKKKKDVFGGLLQEYPELIGKASDGTLKFNDALARTLINNNLVDDQTKAMLENTIALQEARKAALEQINQVITDLAGSLGDSLRNSLVDAFKSGSDAAKAFGDDVSKVIENIVAQFLFSEIFGPQFDKLQDEMKASFDFGGDQSFVDDILRFYENAGPLIDQFNAGLEAANQAGKASGLDIFKKTISPAQVNLDGAVKRELTETTGTALEGLFRSYYDLSKRTYDLSVVNQVTFKQQLIRMDETLAVQIEIRDYSKRTADNTNRLETIELSLATIAKNTATGSTTPPGFGKGMGGI